MAIILAFLALVLAQITAAEDGLDGWLRYAPLPEDVVSSHNALLPTSIVLLGATENDPVSTAGEELRRGFQGIFSKDLSTVPKVADCDASSQLVVGTVDAYADACGGTPDEASNLEADGFWLGISDGGQVKVLGKNARGALYGAFEYLSMLAQGNFSSVNYSSNPLVPIRWANHWDNMNSAGTHGSIERGYGGSSIFFANNQVLTNLTRVSLYGRLLASIRINAIVPNNVNADANTLSDRNIDGIGRIADALRPYGIQVGMSLNFASPQSAGGLSTSDPLDNSVVSWWNKKTDQIYKRIPDLAGYLVKANSEGQPGPITYRRTLADGANMFAKALKPHNGTLMFRAFVYDQLSYSDKKADRANAAVHYFDPLDGKFDDNVVVQVKYGPIDFQVREPASPLFAHLLETNAAIELQITQEYLGQQCHLVYLGPLWKEILEFDLRINNEEYRVRDVLEGKRPDKKRSLGGYAGVVNAGSDLNWMGSHLAMSNLYAFGRLAWNHNQESEDILQDWIRLTFGLDPDVRKVITEASMISWPAYENYTGNLGVQTLTDILNTHYGPNPASQDNNGWGQWTRADSKGIGMDRSVATGTGNAGQYPPEVARIYEDVESTPDDLILWFHHLPYTHTLKSGKTVIQHFYDAHYAGAETAQTFPVLWETLRGKIDEERFEHVLYRLRYQAGHAIVWRDAICTFYHRLSKIDDDRGRVGNHTYRIEAEAMEASGYSRSNVNPSETASGGVAVVAGGGGRSGSGASISTTLNYPDGTYDVAVNYYDVSPGKASWELFVNDKKIGDWLGDIESQMGKDPSNKPDGHSAARMTFRNVTIAKGDTLKVTGKPNGNEAAPLDYVAILPSGVVD